MSAVTLSLGIIFRSTRKPLIEQPGLPSSDSEPIEVLDRDVLRQRTIQIFPSTYATLLSIVQGIALGALVSIAGPLLTHRHGTELWVLIAQCAATLTAIIVVYYNYVWFLLIFRWAPGALDTLIPFVLGTGEIVLAETIGSHFVWLVSLTILQFAAIWAFSHSLRRSPEKIFLDQAVRRATRRLLWLLVAAMSLGTLFGLLALWLLMTFGAWTTGCVAILIVFYGTGMILRAERTMGFIYHRNRLNRLPDAS